MCQQQQPEWKTLSEKELEWIPDFHYQQEEETTTIESISAASISNDIHKARAKISNDYRRE